MQSIPLAVLKRRERNVDAKSFEDCMQSIPLAVLKRLAYVERSPSS